MESKTVFELRNQAKNLEGFPKLNKLTEALNMAQKLISAEPYDPWNQKAFASDVVLSMGRQAPCPCRAQRA